MAAGLCKFRILFVLLPLLLVACGRGERPERVENRWAVSGMRCLAALAEAGALAGHWSPPQGGPCAVDTPVSLFVAHAHIEPPLGTSCAMALAWARFVPRVDALARAHLGTGLAAVLHFGSHACRSMTGNPSRMSLHASARAIDIAGFRLADGSEVRVAHDWLGTSPRSRFLRAVARAACDHFSVVLTPAYDRAHHDHLHFDIGPWRLCGL